MNGTEQRLLAPSTPQFWLGVVVTWALIGSILGLFLKGPPSGANFVMLGLSLIVAAGYLYYLRRANFKLGSRVSAKQVIYYAVLVAVGVGLLIVLLEVR